jgi:hypothetical protein
MARDMYEVRVSGTIPDDLLAELGGLDVVVEPAETVFHGSLPDQSALLGLLARIHGLGLRLLEVRWVVGDSDAAAP